MIRVPPTNYLDYDHHDLSKPPGQRPPPVFVLTLAILLPAATLLLILYVGGRYANRGEGSISRLPGTLAAMILSVAGLACALLTMKRVRSGAIAAVLVVINVLAMLGSFVLCL